MLCSCSSSDHFDILLSFLGFLFWTPPPLPTVLLSLCTLFGCVTLRVVTMICSELQTWSWFPEVHCQLDILYILKHNLPFNLSSSGTNDDTIHAVFWARSPAVILASHLPEHSVSDQSQCFDSAFYLPPSAVLLVHSCPLSTGPGSSLLTVLLKTIECSV